MTSGEVSRIRRELDTASRGGPKDIQDAWQIAAHGAPYLMATLIDVAKNSENDAARVAAAKAGLAIVGLGGAPDVAIQVIPPEHNPVAAQEFGKSPAEQVRERMRLLAERSAAYADDADHSPTGEGEQVIIDAEIVDP